MEKIGLGILITVVIAVLTVGVALALPTLPDKAKMASPAINDEGNLVAPPAFVTPFPPQLSESELTKIVFIRYAPGFQKEKTCDYDGVCEPEIGEKWQYCADCSKPGGGEEEPITVCYDFLAGSKPSWNWVENYVYNDENLKVPSSDAVTTWEAPVSGDIFGVGSYDTTGYDWGVYDYTNSITYGNYDDTGMCPTSEPCVIAVTAIWFRGKNIYEYDIMFDTDFFPGTGDIDLPTVTLHEFGHGAGLDDLYDEVCSDNVMYGYYTGVKTTLGPGDIAGIQKLYGGF